MCSTYRPDMLIVEGRAKETQAVWPSSGKVMYQMRRSSCLAFEPVSVMMSWKHDVRKVDGQVWSSYTSVLLDQPSLVGCGKQTGRSWQSWGLNVRCKILVRTRVD